MRIEVVMHFEFVLDGNSKGGGKRKEQSFLCQLGGADDCEMKMIVLE